MSKETLSWSIDGEFICEIARTWFWDENRPYEKSEELLLSALGTDEITLEEKKRIAQDIIEGRKKLVGINTCTLEDDNERIRPISNKIEELKSKVLLNEIIEDMQVHALRYIDPYSTVKSVKAAKENKNIYTYEDAYDYFCFNELDFHKNNDLSKFYPNTKCGLWLFDYPEMIAKCYKKKAPLEGSDEAREFWEAIYDKIKDWTGEFRERNARYIASIKLNEEKEQLRKKQFNEAYQKIRMGLGLEKQNELKNKNSNLMTSEEYIEYLISKEPGRLDHRIIPDDMEKFEGLIRPDGAFFSCEFGGHNIKAFHYIAAYYKEFGFSSRNEVYKQVPMDQALDYLIEAGWIATRYMPSIGNYISAKQDIHYEPTKEQKNSAWNVIVKHDCIVSNTKIIL